MMNEMISARDDRDALAEILRLISKGYIVPPFPTFEGSLVWTWQEDPDDFDTIARLEDAQPYLASVLFQALVEKEN